MENEERTNRYNFIYRDLVENSEDLVGLVAYSIYKEEKINYIKDFEERNGRTPSLEELKEFHLQTSNRTSQYKELATIKVNNFLLEAYKSQSEQLESEYKDKLISELKQSKQSFWVSVVKNIIVSIVSAVVIALFIVCILYTQHGLTWMLQQIINAMNCLPPQ